MVVDPVCKMPLDPATAVASEQAGTERVYFCSQRCHERYLADPGAYARSAAPAGSGHGAAPSGRRAHLLVAGAAGFAGSGALLGIYFGLVSLLSGAEFAAEEFVRYWPYIVALALGFGVQVGLFVYLRRMAHSGAGKVVAAGGAASGTAMLSCCAHYLANLLPVLGATGLVSLLGQYQVEVFWVGIAANVAGIIYMGRHLSMATRGVHA